LYYSHPILDVLADFFGVTHERVSLIPTCSQAGYATGLILLCPLGDLVRRRHFVLLLTFITAALWIGVCVTSSFEVFLVLSYLSSVTTVTPVSETFPYTLDLRTDSNSKSCFPLLGISYPRLAARQPYLSFHRGLS
jgi:MFS family permease